MATKLARGLPVDSVFFKNDMEENIDVRKGLSTGAVANGRFTNAYMVFGTLAQLKELPSLYEFLFHNGTGKCVCFHPLHGKENNIVYYYEKYSRDGL